MTAVVLAPHPVEFEAFLERRRALGQDRFDEVWEGVYHVVPGPGVAHGLVVAALVGLLQPYAQRVGLRATTQFNLGGPDDYRVPDAGYHRATPRGTWVPTAAIVIEVVSPDDETYAKFAFYAARGVEELLVGDPALQSVRCWRLAGSAYEPAAGSGLLGVLADELTAQLDWPDPD